MRCSLIAAVSAALVFSGCSRSIEDLAEDLRAGDWRERMAAVEEFADRGLMDYAALGLADDDSRVRNTAIGRLAGMGDEAVPAILAVLVGHPEDETTLAASVEVLEKLGTRALDGVLEAVWRGDTGEAEMGYLILRRVRGAGEELERMLSEPKAVVRLLKSELPRVRISAIGDLVTRDPEYLERLLDLFSDGRVAQYTAAAAVESAPDPLPGADLFGPPGAGLNVLNNFTALSLNLFIHRQRLLAAGEDESLRDGMAGSADPVYMTYYDEVPWRVFHENCARAAERVAAGGGAFENLTLDQFVELTGELSAFYHAVSEAHFDFEGSARLLEYSKEFALLRGEVAALVGGGG
ncbi:MAG: hypothetical protein A2Y64_08225 [Candidatus Coatesbacteria bacterium RBG_13_66_14]|uniref:HEAT repeat domain-containing protein n=1 Tax=Candidatus Coatesbacteria bacterium RBG_13_66_14 TaxID=1817816 RepID=A0A1F5EY12_9BACT|nr:MAG: hypothetical protein A2Y64_08225 [Candidatus Coatesbacteria bacterium RBG_13_66_14]